VKFGGFNGYLKLQTFESVINPEILKNQKLGFMTKY
jgi:hypothetical protein